MTNRLVHVFLLVGCLAAGLAMASQPSGYAGKLIPNPPVFSPLVGDPGLPPVSCGGFHWWSPFEPATAGPDETFVLDLAIVPFRNSGTLVFLAEKAGSGILMLRFADGLVGGLPYTRGGWNDVRVVARPATQDFLLTVNGTDAGPYPFESSCAQQGGCFALGAFGVDGSSFDETDVAWIDSLTIYRTTSIGNDMRVDLRFDSCLPPLVSPGALLVVTPPQKLQKR